MNSLTDARLKYFLKLGIPAKADFFLLAMRGLWTDTVETDSQNS